MNDRDLRKIFRSFRRKARQNKRATNNKFERFRRNNKIDINHLNDFINNLSYNTGNPLYEDANSPHAEIDNALMRLRLKLESRSNGINPLPPRFSDYLNDFQPNRIASNFRKITNTRAPTSAWGYSSPDFKDLNTRTLSQITNDSSPLRGINDETISHINAVSHNFAHVNDIKRQNDGNVTINPNNYSGLSHSLKMAKEATSHYGSSIKALSRAANELRHDFMSGSLLHDSNLTSNGLKQLQNTYYRIQDSLKYASDQGLISRKKGKYHYNAKAEKDNIDTTSVKTRTGGKIYGNTSTLPTVPKISDYVHGRPNDDIEGYRRAMANVGMPISANEAFAARHEYLTNNDPDHKFNGYLTREEARNTGERYTRLSRLLPHLQERAMGVAYSAHRINGFSANPETLHNLAYHASRVTNSNGTGFADPVLNSLKERNTDLGYARNRIHDAINSMSDGDNAILSDQDANHYNRQHNQTIWGAPLQKVISAANDPHSSNNAAAKEYLSYHKAADSLQPLINALQQFQNVVNDVTSTVSRVNETRTTDPVKGRQRGYTYERLNPNTIPGMLQNFEAKHAGTAAVMADLGNAVHRVYQFDQQGNSVRMQEAPNIDTQMVGRAINGGTPERHLDNHIQDWLGSRGQDLGYTAPQMSQFLANLGPTRATSYNTMRAANTEAQFSRLNGVGPEATGQLFSTLANAGGLGTGNHVDQNSLDMSRQFAGMLHNNHLGGDATQQAQGLNSIFGNMINSGQTISPSTAGNVMAMQSVLSHGVGGRVFQGQQGAEQLNSFSHGVAGQFNNNLVRNAFASGMPQYGGQQGLYRLQMDMQEPLKHPTQLNNMVQGLNNIMGPEGAEDELTQMGLSPEGARRVYRESMNGDLTKSHLNSIRKHDKNTGKTVQERAYRQIRYSGNQTVAQLRAIRLLLQQHTSEAGDSARQVENALGKGANNSGPLAGLNSMLYAGFANPFTGGAITTSLFRHATHEAPRSYLQEGKSAIRAFRPKTWKAFARGFKNGHGVFGRLRNGGNAVRSAYGSTHGATRMDLFHNGKSAGKTVSKATRIHPASGVHGATRMARLHPTSAGRLSRAGSTHFKSIAHTARHVNPRALSRVGKVTGFLGRHAKGIGIAGDALTAASDLKGINRHNAGSKIGGAGGDLGGGAIGTDLGAAAGSALGPLGTIGGSLLGGAVGGWAGKHFGSSIGRFFNGHKKSSHSSRSSSTRRTTRRTTYYWLARINHLLPALAKKMEGFSDVDPSLSGKVGSGDSGSSGANSKKGAGTDNDVTKGTGAKTINRTGDSATDNAFAYHAQITPAYTKAAYGNVSNSDDHSHHQDSHNTYNNYVTAPSQNFLSELAQNAENAAQYYGQSHRTDWA